MRLLQIRCGQFAGVLDRVYPPTGEFSEGINILYGPNESGKSTMVRLLSRLLFQPAAIDRRSHREFIQQCFPTQTPAGSAGDFVDGTVVFRSGEGVCRLTKEWGSRAGCTLTLPDGSRIADQARITELLEEELTYSEGLFDAVVFPDQRLGDQALQVLLGPAQKGRDAGLTGTRQEILSVIQQAFVESGGVPVEVLGSKIAEKIAELEGKHWDAEQSVPRRNPKGGRWTKDRGAVLTAFYELEDAENTRCQIEALENAMDRSRRRMAELDEEIKGALERQQTFGKLRDRLTARNANRRSRDRAEQELREKGQLLREWPRAQAEADRAAELAEELTRRGDLDRWEALEALRTSIENLEQELHRGGVSQEDKLAAERTEKEIERLERQLGGMDLSARIRLPGGHPLQVTSVRTGEPVPAEDGVLHLTEAARLVIPGVMEMELSPADIDPETVGAALETSRAALSALLDRCGVRDTAQLEQRFDRCEELRREKAGLEDRLERDLAGESPEALGRRVGQIPAGTRPREEIQADIRALCGGRPADTFAAERRALVNDYMERYHSIRDLEDSLRRAEEELRRAEAQLADAGQLPPEYRDIQDPEAHADRLSRDIEDLRAEERGENTELARMEERLDSLHPIEFDAGRSCEEKQRVFEARKAELAHWKHIQSVFTELKESLLGSPASGLAERFARYLDCVSGGRVSAETENGGSLDLALYSGGHRLSLDILSEGTRDTVALAFRLAVLDELYPEGGGLAVFDDPFTDMDAERRREACHLLREFSKRHQVIFLTCSEEYAGLLGGKAFRL